MQFIQNYIAIWETCFFSSYHLTIIVRKLPSSPELIVIKHVLQTRMEYNTELSHKSCELRDCIQPFQLCVEIISERVAQSFWLCIFFSLKFLQFSVERYFNTILIYELLTTENKTIFQSLFFLINVRWSEDHYFAFCPYIFHSFTNIFRAMMVRNSFEIKRTRSHIRKICSD